MATDDELRKKAEERAYEKIGFYIHIPIVNIFLYAIWYIIHGSNTHPWPIWVTIGWGIGVIAHFIVTFRMRFGFNIEKMIEKEYQELKRKSE